MSRLKNVFCWLSTLVAVLGISRTVQADVIPVDNADFEKIAVATGGYTYTIEAWQTANEAGGPAAWISNGYYTDESTPLNPAIYSTQDEVYQVLGSTFTAGTTYTFVMDIGTRADGDYDWRLYLFNATDGDNLTPVSEESGTVTATLGGGDPYHIGAGVVRYTATAEDDGDAIGIGFGGTASAYYTLYDNASVTSATDLAPIISLDPQDQTFLFGDPEVTLTLSVAGAPPLSYQWRFGGGDIPGATNDTLIIVDPGLTDVGDYDVVVTNPFGTATSATAALTGEVPPVEPAAKAALVNDAVTFSIAIASPGTTYQWKRDGINVAGATGTTLTLDPVALADAGDYTVEVTLTGGTVTAGPATLVVALLPTEPYATVITGDGPIAYWRLGEADGAVTAVDGTGFFDGDYGTDLTLGATGATLGDADTSAFFPGTEDAKVDVFPGNPADINPPVFSVDLWVMPTGGSGFRSPITSRDFFDATEIHGWTFYADDNDVWQFRTGRGLVTDGNPAWNTIEGPAVVNNQWTHLAGTYNGADMAFYVNGALVGIQQNVDYSLQDFNPLWIGAGMTEDLEDIGDFFWVGRVDEVALFDRALTSQEVLDHYAAAFSATATADILSEPMSISRLPTENASFEVSVHSVQPVTYQWQVGGVDIPGATDAVLALPNVQTGDAGMYRVKIGNPAGFIFSSAAELEICSGSCTVEVANAGFDDATAQLADFWNDNGGRVDGGVDGGSGWTTTYYTGGWPTDDSFATTMEGPIRQDLAGRTLVAGVTYTLSVDLFSADWSGYAPPQEANINWRVALTADGESVAEDVWYSDEFQTEGEAIPPGRLISITPDGGHGLTTATLMYTATAADAGKALGIELGGDVTLGATQGDDYYGHMDNVQLIAEPGAVPTTTIRIEWIGGNMVLSWDGAGTLQETGDLLGIWSDVPGAASPTVVIPTTPKNSFRIRE